VDEEIFKMKIFGFIPARMGAFRFPGKPLKKILNKTMLEHVYDGAKRFKGWSELKVATCDQEIKEMCESKKISVVMTSKKHKRCLDRVHEASKKNKTKIKNNDLVICIQGDEPMLKANMIDNLIAPFKKKNLKATVLAMEIIDKNQYYDPNIVKIVHDVNGRVLYSTRSPVPYAKKFSKKINAKRIYGMYAFKWSYLKKFNKFKPSPLEIAESCDTNRISDNGTELFIAKQKYQDSFSVDTINDLRKVEKYMTNRRK